MNEIKRYTNLFWGFSATEVDYEESRKKFSFSLKNIKLSFFVKNAKILSPLKSTWEDQR